MIDDIVHFRSKHTPDNLTFEYTYHDIVYNRLVQDELTSPSFEEYLSIVLKINYSNIGWSRA